MIKFKKEDLKYPYNWTSGENSKQGICYDLDRKDGPAVLWFINRYMELTGLSAITTFQGIEIMLHEAMPKDLKEISKIKKWLDENY